MRNAIAENAAERRDAEEKLGWMEGRASKQPDREEGPIAVNSATSRPS